MNIRTPIIPLSAPQCHGSDWKSEIKNAFRSSDELLRFLDIDASRLPFKPDAHPDFPLRVPRPFAQKMAKGDEKDPLLLQVLSSFQEREAPAGYQLNPLQETSSQASGLLHKYKGRVLLVLSGACAVNCRYCFRRHFPYQENAATGARLERALAYIQKQPDVTEVILSGGDPLMLDDSKICKLIEALEKIPSVSRLRIHTRLPVVIPSRITTALKACLSQSSLDVAIVFHINHPNEIDSVFSAACQPLRQTKIHLLNQAVLLKNINDNSQIQIELVEKLFATGILPYYLHLLDPVVGAAHFDVAIETGQRIINTMRSQLPGYLVPRLAREIPGETSKRVIA